VPRMPTTAAVGFVPLLLLGLAGCGGQHPTAPAAEPPFVPYKPTLGAFAPMPPLPEARAYASVIEVGGFVYVIGGLPPLTPPRFPNATTSVFVSRMLAGGELEPWGSATPLNVPRSRPALAAWVPTTGPRYLLAIGGKASDNFGQTSVERAIIQPDGMLSPWELVATLPSPHLGGPAVQTSDLVAVLGGFEAGGDTRVLVAALGPEGPGPWREGTRFPERSTGGAALAVGPRIHLAIGSNTLGVGMSPRVLSSSLEPAGTVAAWSTAPSLVVPRYHAAVAGDGHGGVIAVGGITFAGHTPSLEHAASDRSGALLPWTPLGALPVPTGAVAAVGTRGAVYVLGGLVGAGSTLRPTADVWRAAVN
jgi:hypothetical protein